MIKQYVKRPIPIEAINVREIAEMEKDIIGEETWLAEALASGELRIFPDDEFAEVHTLEGRMTGSFDDYLIRGVRGELYICEGNIFEETYEPVD